MNEEEEIGQLLYQVDRLEFDLKQSVALFDAVSADYLKLEIEYMALAQKYAEIASALGFENRVILSTPPTPHEDILLRVTSLMEKSDGS